MKKIILFIVIIILTGCRSKNDEKLQTVAMIYVENVMLEDKYSDRPDTLITLRNKIFEKYRLSKDEYKKIFDGLSAEKEKWDEFFTLSEKYLDTLKNRNSLN
jgi:hypothetical protein